jgi:hypothetical protein
MRMIADGVDPADPAAGEAWLAEYNTSPAGAGNESSHHGTPNSGQRARSASRAKRSAVKQARRRNRR